MAHKKGVGSTDNGRDSNPKFLGVKLFGGQYAKAGNIIVRQRGTKFHPGDNVYMGRDHTLHAKIEGHVSFIKKRAGRTYVNIIPMDSNGGSAIQSPKARKQAAAPKAAAPATQPAAADNLTKIEGIGPKIAEHLNAAGVTTFTALASTSADKIRTWPQQAGLAAAGSWDQLQVLQDKLDGGKVVDSEEE